MKKNNNKQIIKCPECGKNMVLRNSKHGLFYGCSAFPECKAAHGAHPDGKPLGIPANKETKQWRIKAHDIFDAWWKAKGMKRKEAYKAMQEIMGISNKEAHIGSFNIEQCKYLSAYLELTGGI